MVVRVCIALSAATEQLFMSRLLPTTRDEVVIMARVDVTIPIIPQVLSVTEQCDLVIYDPSLDDGHGLMLWRNKHIVTPVCCWCTNPDDVARCAGVNPLLILLDRSSAVDVDVAIRRCKRMIRASNSTGEWVARSPEAEYRPEVVGFPHMLGIEVCPCESIVHVEGQGNYTNVVFDGKPKLLLSRTIGDYEEVLSRAGFVRVHRSHIVNLRHVRRVMPGKVPRLLLTNGDVVSVSERYRSMLLGKLNVIKRR